MSAAGRVQRPNPFFRDFPIISAVKRVLSGLLAGILLAAALPQGAWAQLAAARAAASHPAVPSVPAAAAAAGLSPLAPLSVPSSPGLTNPSLPSAQSPVVHPSLLPVVRTAAPAAAASIAPAASALPADLPPAGAAYGRAAPAPASGAAAADAQAPAAAEAGAEPQSAFESAPAPTRDALRTRFRELHAAFGLRQTQDLPLSRADAPQPQERLRPSQSPENPPEASAVPAPAAVNRRVWLGFGSALTFFLAALAVEQIGIETQAAAMPPLLAKVFGSVTVSADLGIWSALADFSGSLLAPLIIKRLGLKSAYLWTTGARLVAGGVIAGFLAVGHMTLPALIAATVFSGFVGGMNYAIEKSIPPVLLNQDRSRLESFKAARQSVIEVVATIFPIITGSAIAVWGFLPALVAYPVSAAIGMAIVALTLKMPAKAARVLNAKLPDAAPVSGSGRFWRSLTRGANIVLRTPALRWSFFGYALLYVSTPLLYWLVAPAYGIFVAGAAGAEHAALVAGFMLGLFSLGGLVASMIVMRENKRLGKLGEAERLRALGRSLVRWGKWAVASLALLGLMALPLPSWGALTVPALALLPFGVAQVVAKLKVDSYFQSRAPEDGVDDATAFMEGAAMLLQMAVLWAAKLAFTAFTGVGPFVALAAGLVPAAAALYWVIRRLAKLQES